MREATERGVGLVFQEITINPALSVAENVFLGQLRRFQRGGLLSNRRLERMAQEVLDSFSAGISTAQPLASLDLGQWKCIEIARALASRPKVLLLDESTAFLNHREVDSVLSAMRSLKRLDMVIAFVSHHLAEVERVADRLTILKDGRKVGDFDTASISRDQIQARMVGRAASAAAGRARRQATPCRPRARERWTAPRSSRPAPSRRRRGWRRCRCSSSPARSSGSPASRGREASGSWSSSPASSRRTAAA